MKTQFGRVKKKMLER